MKNQGPVAEIERKFLMKGLPIGFPGIKFLYIKDITHYYVNETRYTVDEYDDSRIEYVKCTKNPLPGIDGGNSEDEVIITQQEFIDAIFSEESLPPYRRIAKTRYVFDVEGKEWEFDVFAGIPLLMAEVEWIFPLDSVDMNRVNSYQVPEILKSLVITEVTGNTAFSNYNLSKNIPTKTDFEAYDNYCASLQDGDFHIVRLTEEQFFERVKSEEDLKKLLRSVGWYD